MGSIAGAVASSRGGLCNQPGARSSAGRVVLAGCLVMAVVAVGRSTPAGQSPPAWVEAALSRQPSAKAVDDKAMCLLEAWSIEVDDQGRRRITHRRVLTVNTSNTGDFRRFGFEESFGRQLEELRAWHRPEGGSWMEIDDRLIRQAPGGELYSDARGVWIEIPHIGPGSCVAYELVYRDDLAERSFDCPLVGGIWPVVAWEYRVDLPSGWSAEGAWWQGEQLTPAEPRRDGSGGWTWARADVPAVLERDAPLQPPAAESAQRLCVRWIDPERPEAMIRTWDDVAAWSMRFGRDALAGGAALTAIADSLLGPLELREDKAARALAFVRDGIHYVQIYRDDGGWRPHLPADVLRHRFGDCKDMAYALVALLRNAGVRCYPALVNGGDVEWIHTEFPAPLFDHCIVAVEEEHRPGAWVFCDPTAKGIPWRALPAASEDRWALVLRDDAAAVLCRLPASSSAANRSQSSVELTVLADGGALARVVERHTGHQARTLRGWVQHRGMPALQAEWGQALQVRYPGATLNSLGLEGLDEESDSLIVRCHIEYPKLGHRVSGRVYLPLVSGCPASRVAFPEGPRRNPVVFPYACDREVVLRVTWPAAFRALELPPDTLWESEGFSFERATGGAEDGFVCRTKECVRQSRIPAERYGEAVAWSRLLADHESRWVLGGPR